MQVKFQTKEESNIEQKKEFLSLTPAQRFNRFLKLITLSNSFYNQNSDYPKHSFIVKRKNERTL